MAESLMRKDLKKLLTDNHIRNAHAGLLMQRGLREWETEEEKKRKRERNIPIEKEKLINKIQGVSPNDFYLLAFNRWLTNTYNDGENNLNFANVSANIEGRLYTGLSTDSTLETGATTHHTYGMPMLAGSSIKGAVRSYAEQHFTDNTDKQTILAILFGADGEESGEETANSDAGYIIWHDAWWIPTVTSQGTLSTAHDSNKPFAEEVVTVHQEKYYKGTLDQALDMESPIPNQQIGIQGAFYFALEGEEEWVALAKELLEATLQHQGMGAKGSSGYGYFLLDEQLDDDVVERYNRYMSANFIPDVDDEYSTLREAIKRMKSKDLIVCLSKNKNRFFSQFALDSKKLENCQLVARIVFECHHNTVVSWKDNTDKNKAKAYKFIQNNISQANIPNN